MKSKGFTFLTLACVVSGYLLISNVKLPAEISVKPMPRNTSQLRGITVDSASNTLAKYASKYVELSNSEAFSKQYQNLVARHMKVPKVQSRHCGNKAKVPTPENFFRLRKTIVNPFNYTILTQPGDNFCKNNTFLVVFVLTHHAHIDRRNTIRNTWGYYSLRRNGTRKSNIRQIFVFGTHHQESMIKQVLKEHQLYGDVLQANIKENYRNLPYKSRLVLQWITKSCQAAKYVLKVDDDIVPNIPKIYKMLQTTRGATRSVQGHCNTGSTVIRYSKSKFFATCSEYPFDTYPMYLNGPVYIMTADIVQDLFDAALYLPNFYIDDVYITGFLTLCSNVTMVCAEGYAMKPIEQKNPSMSINKQFMFTATSKNDTIKTWNFVEQMSKDILIPEE